MTSKDDFTLPTELHDQVAECQVVRASPEHNGKLLMIFLTSSARAKARQGQAPNVTAGRRQPPPFLLISRGLN